ncbi:MAG: desulfoferrodoxin [Paludibacteraceae bacterium]|nr:desulfoferrodoxin [Paludibacteraceae bacterium]
MKTKFYMCPICGNIITKLVDSGVTPVCCGATMREMTPNGQSQEVSQEKHVPVVHREDACTLRVDVGSLPHPMMPEHHIRFIWVETEHGAQLQFLHPEQSPTAEFYGCKDRPTAVYEYCNIHGLWATDQIPEQHK